MAAQHIIHHRGRQQYPAAILCLFCLLLIAMAQAFASDLPLFDAHVHYNEDIWQAMPAENAIQRLKKTGIRRAIVSSTPAEGTLRLFKQDPEFVIPFLRPYRSPYDRWGNWFTNPEVLDYVRSNLERFDFKGLGEFHLMGSQVDTAVMKGILELAKEKNLVLLAHSNPETIDALLAVASNLTIIWAHGGFDVDVDFITSRLQRHKNLMIELSFREGITEEGHLTTKWRNAFMQFPSRFLAGTDTYIGQRWLELPELTNNYQAWLAQLPTDIAEAIAYKNGESMFSPNAVD